MSALDLRPRGQSAHLSSLGLAGLHLEMVSSHVNSIAGRLGGNRDRSEPSLIAQYDEELEKQSIARDAFRAELERMTGLPADLIERRLSL
ncbi:hypothetical protein K3M67_03135 [Sphingobium sp. V4]|uniref:hypothetical protein n=1 Tax=Sphingobium sp. V4 TaxID=3038927 RepID=UPI00255832E2|nr:hypothetical protein [Sphingobium sp. V4]WIW88991.1 hypothetical protein K3M67_03135 [Sphingobium sp. V4]